jgi:hypothetical protein
MSIRMVAGKLGIIDRESSLRKVDLNHRPLGYEPTEGWNFNNLQDAGGARSHCKERQGTVIGQLVDR